MISQVCAHGQPEKSVWFAATWPGAGQRSRAYPSSGKRPLHRGPGSWVLACPAPDRNRTTLTTAVVAVAGQGTELHPRRAQSSRPRTERRRWMLDRRPRHCGQPGRL